MTEISTPRSIFLGYLRRDFMILPEGKVLLDIPGGNLIYAAVGYKVWEMDPPPGLVARIGEDYSQAWIENFAQHGLDVRGIRILPEAIDARSFFVCASREVRYSDDPVMHFSRIGQPFPKALLGYRIVRSPMDSRTQLGAISLRQPDMPPEYLGASAAHLCPVDYLTHTLMPAVLRQVGFMTITLDPSPGTMTPMFWDDIPALVTGLTAFLSSEAKMRALFHGRSIDLREMVEQIASYGSEFVVVKRGERGQLLFDAASHTFWEIPAYPARVVNPIGAGDAFCGGFLVGYRRTFDPVQAVLHGSISASLVVEGNGPFYALDSLPGLSQARLTALQESVLKL